MTTAILGALDALAPIDLDELNALAALQTRIDRKYLVPLVALDGLLQELEPGARILQIGADRDFAYESVYFDTPDLTSYLGAARRRRRRYKVRTRTYVDSAECWVEVKTRGSRGSTVKTRQEHDPDARERLTTDARRFADGVLDDAHLPEAVDGPLAPTLVSRYRRTTLYLPGTQSRTTLDTDLVWTAADTGEELALRGFAVVETKTGSTPSSTDRLLWRHGYRPLRMSKYGTGMAALHPELPAAPWRRVLDRHLTLALH
ncbi:molecular chaperone [Cellulomonas sp. WB94]|uniref:polyphosphate polymerase domain-containing protein n=1 Tax=Cellulomonas sp. WB94 TaxID=2173174 RepID=UPI000D5868F4|nr:polyphosphate polymerase domain-containing protein [Cellulomonas sp. WB94]PVU82697.1 molecular chaperone [Cellulomonas sp. WB94]